MMSTTTSARKNEGGIQCIQVPFMASSGIQGIQVSPECPLMSLVASPIGSFPPGDTFSKWSDAARWHLRFATIIWIPPDSQSCVFHFFCRCTFMSCSSSVMIYTYIYTDHGWSYACKCHFRVALAPIVCILKTTTWDLDCTEVYNKKTD